MIAAIVLLALVALFLVAAFADLSGRWTDTIGKGRDLWKDDK